MVERREVNLTLDIALDAEDGEIFTSSNAAPLKAWLFTLMHFLSDLT